MSIRALGSDVNMSYPNGCMSRSAQLEVNAATVEQMPIVANLIQLYAHDFSEYHHLELDADGRFGYEPLPLYWSEPNRHPFLVRMDGNLAGFVLVKSNGAVWDMAEFFVVRGYRRQGIGTAIAHDIWKRFPGPWTVRVMQKNHSAANFWNRAISEFTGVLPHPVTSERWHIFSFDSRPSLAEPRP